MLLSRSSSVLLRSRSIKPLLASRTFHASSPTPDVSKKDIAAEVAETHELSVAKADRIVNTVFDTIVEAVADEKAVRIAKFGVFESYLAAARKGVNPSTGEAIQIPSKQRVRFRPSSVFKKTANGEV